MGITERDFIFQEKGDEIELLVFLNDEIYDFKGVKITKNNREQYIEDLPDDEKKLILNYTEKGKVIAGNVFMTEFDPKKKKLIRKIPLFPVFIIVPDNNNIDVKLKLIDSINKLLS